MEIWEAAAAGGLRSRRGRIYGLLDESDEVIPDVVTPSAGLEAAVAGGILSFGGCAGGLRSRSGRISGLLSDPEEVLSDVVAVRSGRLGPGEGIGEVPSRIGRTSELDVEETSSPVIRSCAMGAKGAIKRRSWRGPISGLSEAVIEGLAPVVAVLGPAAIEDMNE